MSDLLLHPFYFSFQSNSGASVQATALNSVRFFTRMVFIRLFGGSRIRTLAKDQICY